MAQYGFFTVIMRPSVKIKRAGIFTRRWSHRSIGRRACTARRKNGPTREAASYFLHVLLCIAAIHTQGVQFH